MESRVDPRTAGIRKKHILAGISDLVGLADRPSLPREPHLHALRSALALSWFLGQELHLDGLTHRLTVIIAEVDRLLEEECDQ